MGVRLVLTVLAPTMLFGCNSCGGAETNSVEEPAVGDVDTTPRGVVEGVVRLVADAELPSYPVPRLEEGGTMPVPEGCPPRQQGDRHPVQRSGDGVTGVQVTAMMGLDLAPDHQPTTHEAVIRDCRLTPALIDATRGDELVLRNESDYPFVPVLGSSAFGRALLQGQSRTIELERGGVPAVTCGFPAPCGRTDVIINFHSVHVQSAEGGSFRLEGVPAGERVVVAYHPLLVETEQTVTVGAGETVRVEFEVEVRAPPEPPPQAPDHEGPAEDQEGVLF